MNRFEITEVLLQVLRERQFDAQLVEALENLVGRGFDEETEFLAAIHTLTGSSPSDEDTATILRSADRKFQEAVALLERAYREHMRGDLQEAIRLYRRSIGLFPTAEAHTFLGWAFSFQNHYDKAIAECKTAIAVDPEFGNPYNDIGSYLIALEKPGEAIPWLKKATTAARYEPRHFPWANLGRVYETLGEPDKALDSYMQAYEIAPDYEFVKKSIGRLCGPPEKLN